MEKRVILAVALSFLVLSLYRVMYTPTPSSEPATNTQAPATATPATKAATNPESSKEPESAASAPADIHGEKSEELAIETPMYRLTFSNTGAVLKSVKLKSYLDGQGNPLELINQEAGSKVGWPLAFATEEKSIVDQLRNGVFAAKQETGQLAMEFAGNGLHARKVFRFDPENYEFSLDTSLTKDGRPVPYSVVWQGTFGDQSIPQDPNRKNALYLVDSAFKKIGLRSLKDQVQTFASSMTGVEDQYFLAMFMSGGDPAAVRIGKQDYPGPDGKPVSTLMVSTAAANKPIRLFVGPKQRDSLVKADPQLAAALDYGYFGFIAKPLVFALLWVHSYIGNFGWSIIVLTVALNLVLFPLRLKQQISMLKMQKIQPQMRRLQDQYKKLKANDPRRTQVQTEMMGLYKEHGVNPMGGCLPLLLQMPFLFGFYSALAYSIELRRAPWILWVTDLSRPDYVFGSIPILAILMAVCMFVQQKLTPTGNVDPAQAKMMMMMPLLFTFMFWSQSSGLVLYWLTGSVIGIGQQIFMNKYWSPQAEAKIKARSRPDSSGA
jgi:YidC/Oxa1 family membrane protein insertase